MEINKNKENVIRAEVENWESEDIIMKIRTNWDTK